MIIGCLLVCKYNSRASHDLLPFVWPLMNNNSASSSTTKNSHDNYAPAYTYKPLTNEALYEKEQYLVSSFS